MTKQEKYESIEAYLAGKLTGEEKADFEKKLSQDNDLAMEVNLHKRVQSEIGDATKRELRGILVDLKKQHITTEKRDNIRQLKPRRNLTRVLSIAASVMLLGMAFWYFMMKDPDAEQPIAQDAPAPIEAPTPTETAPIPTEPTPSPSDGSQLAQEDTRPPINQPEQTPTDDTPERPETPSFDPFEVNPALEELVASSGATPHEFEVELPVPNTQLTINNGKARFGLLGTLFTESFPDDDRFVVSIYDNKPDSYSNNQPVFRSKMNFEKAEGQQELAYAGEEREIYYFQMRENLAVDPGVYYWIISLEKGGTVVASGKMEINQ